MQHNEQTASPEKGDSLLDDSSTQGDTASKQKVPFGVLVRRMAKIAVTPQKLILLVVFLAAAAVCARLGVWQLDRAYERAHLAEEHAKAEAAEQQPDPLGDVLRPQETFAGSLVGKLVSVSGTFDSSGRLLVAGRHLDGATGFLVLEPLIVEDDGTDGASWAGLSGNPKLPVVRGWIPQDAVISDGQISDEWAAKIDASPTSTTLVGWLQAGESTLDSNLPAGQTNSISSAALANAWGSPIYSGYMVVQSADPAQSADLQLLPRPQVEGGEGLNLQNLFYALQWWVFGAFAIALWLRLLADEAKRGYTETPTNPFDLLNAQTENAPTESGEGTR